MMRRLLEDFASTPIANTASLTMLVGSGICAWHGDMYGTLLFLIVSNQWQIQRKLP